MKRIIAICAAAVILLSGCEKGADSGSGSRSNPDLITNSGSSTDTSSNSVSETASDTSESTGQSSDSSDTSENSGDVSGGASDPDKPDKPEKIELLLRGDPKLDRRLVIQGKRLEVTGKADGVEFVVVFYNDESVADFEMSYDGDRFTAVFTAEEDLLDGGYAAISIDGGVVSGGGITRSDNYRIKTTSEGFSLIDVSDIAKNNSKAAADLLEQPLNQVAEYIVKGSDPGEIKRVLSEIKALSDEICEGLDNEYDKLGAIADWVSANIYYDHVAFDMGVPEETLSLDYMLKYKRSVCGGYSNMTAALCAAQGIECHNVHGAAVINGLSYAETTDDALHEWNYAVIDGRGIWVDAGWNSHNHYNGEYYEGGYDRYYFDLGGEFFALLHKAKYCEHRDYFALVQ